MIFEKNRLWGCLPTEENLKTLQKYKHCKANAGYCLVIAPEQPEDMVEMTDEYLHELTPADWQWLLREGEAIRREEEIALYDEMIAKQEEFLGRFKAELLKMKEGSTNAGRDEGTAE